MVSIKFKTNYIRFIYHLKGDSVKKCNVHYIGCDYVFSNVNICGPVTAVLENITNLEILPYLLHFS